MSCDLQLNNVGVFVEYNESIIKEVSLSLKPGVHALVGPNGAGKTTLLKAIAGIISHTGSIRYCNKESRDVTSLMSYMPATAFVDPLATVEDVIRAGLYGSRGDINNALYYLKKLGLKELIKRRFNTLSSGEQRLVCISRALARKPSLLLLDEPLSFLDVRNQVRVLELLREYSDSNDAIVLLTTHEIHYLWIFDSIGVMSDGRLVYHGEPSSIDEELLERVYGINLLSAKLDSFSIFLPNIRLKN